MRIQIHDNHCNNEERHCDALHCKLQLPVQLFLFQALIFCGLFTKENFDVRNFETGWFTLVGVNCNLRVIGVDIWRDYCASAPRNSFSLVELFNNTAPGAGCSGLFWAGWKEDRNTNDIGEGLAERIQFKISPPL